MDNRDIFFQIATRLNNKTLFALYLLFRDEVKKLVDDNNFWYIRCEFLVGKQLSSRSANWSRIYSALEQEMDPSPHLRYKSALDYLPSLMVFEEAFGLPDWTFEEQELVWSSISSSEVLQHLLDKRLLTNTTGQHLGIDSAAKNGWTEMILPMYKLMLFSGDFGEVAYSIVRCSEYAIENNHQDTAQILVQILLTDMVNYRKENEDEIDDILGTALENGSRYMIELVDLLYASNEQLKETIRIMLYRAKPDTIQLLIDMRLVDLESVKRRLREAIFQEEYNIIEFLVSRRHISDLPWYNMLRSAIENCDSYDYVSYLLTKANPATKRNRILELAMDRPNLVSILLEDPRIDPMDNLREVLVSGRVIASLTYTKVLSSPSLSVPENKGSNPSVDLVLRDNRVRIEKLDLKTVRVALWLIRSSINSRTTEYKSELIQHEVEEDSLYGLILRFILIKSPTGTQMFDWMIELHNPMVASVARSVIDNRSLPRAKIRDLLPIRALMLLILYPTLSLQELMSDLRDELGATEDESIARSRRLINAYLGTIGVQNRELK